MATPKVGRGGAWGIGAESTWATEVARSKWYAVESFDVESMARFEPVAVLVGSSGSANRKEFFQADETTGGNIIVPDSYQDMGLILQHVLGGSPSSTGTGPYTHTYKLGASLPTGLTSEFLRGNGNAEEAYGCKINTATWSIEANGYARWELGVIAKSTGARASGGSPSFSTPHRVKAYHAAAMTFDSASYTLKKVSVRIDNKLARIPELGSLYTAEPERGDFCEVIIDAELHYYGDALYTAHKAGTQGDVVCAFTDPITSYSKTWTLHNAIVKECKAPVSSAGILTQRVQFYGFTDGTDEGLQCVVVNNQSGATA